MCYLSNYVEIHLFWNTFVLTDLCLGGPLPKWAVRKLLNPCRSCWFK